MIAPCLEAIYKHIHWTPNLSTFKTKNTATFKITFSTFQISISVPKISVAREREREAEKGYDGNNTFNDKITYMADACIVARALVRGKLQRHTHTLSWNTQQCWNAWFKVLHHSLSPLHFVMSIHSFLSPPSPPSSLSLSHVLAFPLSLNNALENERGSWSAPKQNEKTAVGREQALGKDRNRRFADWRASPFNFFPQNKSFPVRSWIVWRRSLANVVLAKSSSTLLPKTFLFIAKVGRDKRCRCCCNFFCNCVRTLNYSVTVRATVVIITTTTTADKIFPQPPTVYNRRTLSFYLRRVLDFNQRNYYNTDETF